MLLLSPTSATFVRLVTELAFLSSMALPPRQAQHVCGSLKGQLRSDDTTNQQRVPEGGTSTVEGAREEDEEDQGIHLGRRRFDVLHSGEQ